ncbi:SDR family oxidoreductase [Nocardia sp. NPDC058499]|uniref:SDR family oxidoreductase n=1 Tax=Nocardia sp. NPDC058499 TaxID=3346530 RepID=UPI0036614513
MTATARSRKAHWDRESRSRPGRPARKSAVYRRPAQPETSTTGSRAGFVRRAPNSRSTRGVVPRDRGGDRIRFLRSAAGSSGPSPRKALRPFRHIDDDAGNVLLAKTPLHRFGDPEADIGRVAVFLASADADYITGQTIMVDGGSIKLR